ncbi:MAG: DUF4430 domain-containing protein [Clostridia bacterium]|nr:DUF4430 domain-containing protein [Clostridia bacterium]
MDRLRLSDDQAIVRKVKSDFIRKIPAIILALCLVFLVSCSKGTASSSTATGAEQTAHTLSSDELTAPSEEAGTTASVPEAEKTTVREDGSNEKGSSSVSSKASATKKSDESSTAQDAKTTSPTSEPNRDQKYCYLSIECSNVLKEDNFAKLETVKKGVVPSDGVILKKTKTAFKDGENVYDIFKRACQNNVCSHNCKYCNGRIQFETVPSNFGTYVRGIHFLYEKDCGTRSGWMYKVNGVFPDYAIDYYILKENDVVEFVYTCELGDV